MRGNTRQHRKHRAVVAALAGLALWLGGVPAAAQLSVFQSPRNDLVPSATPAPIRGQGVVHVGFDNGTFAPQPGQACDGQGGDEICQWAVRFETTGNVKIVDVAWASGVVEDEEPIDPAVARSGTAGNSVLGQVGGTRIASVSVSGTSGELRLTTPGLFGFLDQDGDVLQVDPSGVVLARAPELGWSRLSAGDAHTCGLLTNGELRCVGSAFSIGTPPAGAYRRLAVGPDFGCVLDFDNQISCWGSLPAPPGTTYLGISAGDAHVCGLLPSLEAECWGTIAAPAPGPFRRISRGGGHACGLLLDAGVVCWGDDTSGQVSGVPADSYTAIAGGADHTCAIRADGTLVCWGDDAFGQSSPPFPAATYIDVSAGARHTCAIRTDNTVDCWGSGSSGETTPPPGATFQSLSLTDGLSCGVRTDGSATCWGAGTNGSDTLPAVRFPQVASGPAHTCQARTDGSLECWSTEPAFGSLITDFEPAGTYRQLDAAGAYGCALEEDGTVACWGFNSSSATFPPGGTFTHVVTAQNHACGLRPDATAICWGDDTFGQASPPAGSFLRLAAGEDFTCGIRPTLAMECWGLGTSGQTSPPTGQWVDVSAGATHACGLRQSGTLSCWGLGGAAGMPPTGLFSSIDVAAFHSCGVRTDATPACFGDDSFGESSPPALGFQQISAHGVSTLPSFAHSCGVTSQGSVACWGANNWSQSAPPLDLDADGLEDPVDNCPADANPTQTDTDADGVGDACDNCPIYNPNQHNRDGDLAGDICDACPDSPTASLPGETCQTTISLVPVTLPMGSLLPDPLRPGGQEGLRELRVPSPLELFLGELVRRISPAPATAQSATPAYDVVLTCPVEPIGRIELALIVPDEIDLQTLDFGPGCTDTSAAPDVALCTTAPALHPRVDPNRSFVLVPPVDGGRADALYFALLGNEDPVGSGLRKLCDVTESNTLATILVNQFPTDGSSPALSPELLTSVADSPVVQSQTLAAGVEFDGKAIEDDGGTEVPFAQYAFTVGSDDAPIKLELRPFMGDTTGADWDIKLSSQVELEIARLGFIPPTASTSITLNPLGVNVSPTTQIKAPGTATQPGTRPDSLYVEFHGNLENADFDLIVVQAGGTTSLGVLRLGTPTGEPPVITLEGAALAFDAVDHFEEPGGTPIASNQALLTGAGATGEDFDGDAVQNDTDNCVFAFNPLQANRGGFLDTGPDSFGDKCQCGDVDLNGKLLDDGSDVLKLRQVVAGLIADPDSLGLCSVADSAACDMKDVIVLQRALAQAAAPPLSAACLRAIPSGEGGDN